MKHDTAKIHCKDIKGISYHWHDVLLLQCTLHDLSDAERTQAIVRTS